MAVRTLLIAFVLACCVAPGAAQRSRKPVTHTVNMEGAVFKPASLSIRTGDTVIWVNKDLMPHTATASGFDSGSIAAGASWKRVFKAKGEFAYVCTFHPTMKGNLRIADR